MYLGLFEIETIVDEELLVGYTAVSFFGNVGPLMNKDTSPLLYAAPLEAPNNARFSYKSGKIADIPILDDPDKNTPVSIHCVPVDSRYSTSASYGNAGPRREPR